MALSVRSQRAGLGQLAKAQMKLQLVCNGGDTESMESVHNPLVLSHNFSSLVQDVMKAVLTIAKKSLGDASNQSHKTYQWAYSVVPERHSKLRLECHCWADPDLALNTKGSWDMEDMSFTALGACRQQAVPLGAASPFLVGGAGNSVVLPFVGLNRKSESCWLVVLGSHRS